MSKLIRYDVNTYDVHDGESCNPYTESVADSYGEWVRAEDAIDLEQELEFAKIEAALWMEMYTELQKKYEDFCKAQAKPWLSDPVTGKM